MELVNEDIHNNREKYNIETVDKNIDFRRVRNLDIYFRNNHIVSISGDEADKKKATEIFLKDLCEAITKEKKRS